MPDAGWAVVLVAGLGMFAGGLVKGVTGMGLPLVAVPILVLVMDLKAALPLVTAPIVLSNVWQIVEAGGARAAGLRFWGAVVTICAGTWLGVTLIAVADPRLLEAILGTVVILFVAANLLRWKPSVPKAAERWLSPAAGAVTGLIGGMTGIFSPPFAMYLLALGVGREAFIGAMGMTMLAGSVAFTFALSGHGLLGAGEAAESLLALLPAMAGLAAGGWIRRRIGIALFQRIVMLLLLVVGLKHLANVLV